MEHRIIDRPLTFAVRKGKAHYACFDRVRNYLSSLRHNDRPEDWELMETLTALVAGNSTFDLDALTLTNYVNTRASVVSSWKARSIYSMAVASSSFLLKLAKARLRHIVGNLSSSPAEVSHASSAKSY